LHLAREETLQKYYATEEAWQAWRKSHDTVLFQHKRREGPDVEGWIHDCSREEFEGQFLRKGARLAHEIDTLEEIIYTLFELCADAGIEPLDRQDLGSPRDDVHGYTISHENALIRSTPRQRILQWARGLPD